MPCAPPRQGAGVASTEVDTPDTAKLFRDASEAEGRAQLWAPLASLMDAMHLVMKTALSLPADARVLLVGVGTGPELLSLAARFPGWHFTALDPAGAMLRVCQRQAEAAGILGRCTFHEGELPSLPAGEPFDAATAITVSHFFMDRDARTRFLSQIAARLRPAGQLFIADLCADDSPSTQARLEALWGDMMQQNLPSDRARVAVQSLGEAVAVLPRDEVEALLLRGGFVAATHVYQGLLLHAWHCHRDRP